MGFLHLPTTTSNCKNTVKYKTILCEIANSIYTLSTIFYSTYNISRMNENLIIRRRHTYTTHVKTIDDVWHGVKPTIVPATTIML